MNPDTDVMLAPWMIVNHLGYVLCLMCPMDKYGRHGEQYYLALRPKRSKTMTAINWMHAHQVCGFEGLR